MNRKAYTLTEALFVILAIVGISWIGFLVFVGIHFLRRFW